MRVLIVDDEPLVRRSLEKVFEKSGHEVATAVDGRAGLSQWQEFQPQGVVLDILMPGLSGPEVLSEMGVQDKVAVALISAYSGDYDLDSVKKMGADIFIEKPFENIRDIVKQVEKIWELKNR